MLEFQQGNTDSLSLAVVEALAWAADEAPEDIDPLYESIDTDALDRLFKSQSDMEGTVLFHHSEYRIEVHSSGKIELERE